MASIRDWFKERQIDGERLQADARHMLERYGPDAVNMCDYAIQSASDPTLRRKLRLVRRLLARGRLLDGMPHAH
jgi:hypothetical protein